MRLDWAAPTVYPIALSDIKAQLRIDHNEFDPLISDFHLPAAFEWAERETGRSLINRTHTWVIGKFPRELELVLPRGKCQSITSITYYSNGTSTAFSSYQSNLDSDQGGVIMPNQGSSWPAADTDVVAPVTVVYVAGYTSTELPAAIKTAIIVKIGEQIETTSSLDGTSVMLADQLISGWKLWKW